MVTPPPDPSREGTAGRMHAYLQAQADVYGFSGSVLAARQGNIVFSGAYGFANLEHRVANKVTTVFRIGSVTKQFTAAAILLLEEDGRLSANDAVRRHITEAPAAWDGITLHHLLTHTSGIASFTSLPDYASTMMLPSEPAKTIARVRDLPLEFVPGSKYAYCNSGYVLLGLVVERLAGTSYGEFLASRIFSPLGMNQTGYDSTSGICLNRAQGYSVRREGPVNAAYVNMTVPHAAGGLVSTVGDLFAWDRALARGQILSGESRRRLVTPALEGYAYGWAIGAKEGRTRISHGGGIDGFVCEFARYPDDDSCVINLSNRDWVPASVINHDVSAILFGLPCEVPRPYIEVAASESVLDSYAGRYEVEPGQQMTLRREQRELIGAFPGQPPYVLYPDASGALFMKEMDLQIRFTRVNDAISSLTIHRAGNVTIARKVS